MQHREVAALERLKRLGGDALVGELTAIYFEEMPQRVAAARIALREHDSPALASVAHSMKSSSAQLGGAELAAACEAVERLAERGDLAAAEKWLGAVESRFEAFGGWLATQTPIAPMRERQADERDGPPTPAAGHRVAVIEDNLDNRLLIDAILGDRFVLDEYGTGADALAGMRSRRPAIALLDVSLPGMDGLDVLARMRSDPALRHIPVVAVTAHAMTGDRERYLDAGFDGYIPKPIVDERVLIHTVERLLSERSSLRADDA